MNVLKVVFMGTPEFAVPSLEILIQHGINVVAVVTAPDKPQGRGQKIVFSPVKECALSHRLPVLQPTNLKNPEFLKELKELGANLHIVVAFRMLPESVWSMPALGTFNLHASLLPHYRGAAPINWAIINGEKETGVSTFFLKHEIDTGSIIFQEKEAIDYNDDAGSLYTRLMHKGARMVLRTVKAIEAGEYPSTPQKGGTDLKHAPKIFKETCEINWSQPGEKVRDFIRGLNPHPGPWAVLQGKTYKIYSGEVVRPSHTEELITPGQFKTDNKKYLWFRTLDGFYSITELQPEGKKRMNIQDFFRGNKL